MRIIAHRGVSSLAPENTIAAFAKCLEVGVSWFEFDIRPLQDGTLAVIHDETLQRTTSGTGLVSDTTFSMLRRLDAGLWFGEQYRFERVPELSTVVELLNEAKLSANMEVKPPAPCVRDAVCETIKRVASKMRNPNKLLISSFDPKVLGQLSDFNLAYILDAAALRADFAGCLARAKSLGCKAIHPEYHGVTEAEIKAMHDAGFEVNVWTVDSIEMAEELKTWGVDGIITNVPQDLVELATEGTS